MGTTSEKLTYLNETKQLLKDKINNLGGSIDDNTTFRNYANQLQNVYDNLPKIEYQEGTEINLGKTIKGKLDYDNGIVGYGDTKQNSTNGYQLIDLKDGTYTKYSLTAIVSNGKVTINGNTDVVAIIEIDLNNTLTLTNGQNYTLYGFNTTTNSEVAFRPIGDYGTFQIDFSTTNNKATRTFGNTTTTLNKIGIRVGAGTSVSNLVCSPMLISGSDTSKSYEPYTNGASPNPSYPQNINSVTGNQDVVVSGINIANENEIQIGKNWNNQVNTSRATILFIPIEKGVTYSFASAYTNSHITSIRAVLNYGVDADNRNLVVNTTTFSTDIYTHVSLEILADTTFTQDMLEGTKILLCEGEATISDYEPYITPTSYQLSLGEYEFNGIPNTDYRDELVYDVDEDKVYKNARIGKAVLKSDMNWSRGGTAVSGKARYYTTYFTSIIKKPSSVSVVGDIMCNYYKAQVSASAGSYGGNQGIAIADTGTVYINDDNYADNLSGWTTWLDSVSCLFYYALDTEVLEEITDTTLKAQVKALYNAHSNNGTTIITSNGDLPLIIKVRALKGE